MVSTRQYPIPEDKNIAMRSILKRKILSYIFTEANHPELIVRLGDFIKETASRQMLTNDHIEMFWNVAQTSPVSAVQEATLDLITKIIKSAEDDQVSLMIKLAASVDVNHITEKYLKFLESLYLSVLHNIKDQEKGIITNLGKKFMKRCDLSLFWNIVTDQIDVPMKAGQASPMKAKKNKANLKKIALKSLMELINQGEIADMKEKYLQEALQMLQSSSDENLLMWIENVDVMVQSSITNYRNYIRLKHPQMAVFFSNTDFLNIILTRLQHLVDKYSQESEDRSRINLQLIFEKSFNFIKFVILKISDNSMPFSKDHVKQMEYICFESNLKQYIPQLENHLYDLFTYNEFVIYDQDKKKKIPYELKFSFYKNLLKFIDPQTLTIEGFRCYNTNFCVYNQKKELLIKKNQEYEFRTRKPGDLIGFDLAWRIAFSNQNKSVREEAQRFIIDKYYYDDDLTMEEKAVNN